MCSKRNSSRFKAYIFGGFVNGYSIARTIYETYGIKSVICDYSKKFSYYSSFVDYKIVPDPKIDEEIFINHILELGKEDITNCPKVIFTTNDEYMIPLSKGRKKVEKYFVYPFADWNVIKKLTVKSELYNICENLKIPFPATHRVFSEKDLKKLKLKFPILVKPILVVDYVKIFKGMKRNVVFENKSELNKYVLNIIKSGYKGGLLLQEYVKGETENLFTVTSYVGKDGKMKGVSTGYKIKQYPKEAGTIQTGFVEFNKKLIEPTQKILSYANFYGISNTEYKYDPQSREYKLIEVNPRPGMWNYGSYLSGVNIIKMSLDEILFRKNVKYSEGREKLIWSIEPSILVKSYIRQSTSLKHLTRYFKKIVNPRKNNKENLRYKINQGKFDIIFFLNKFLHMRIKNPFKKSVFNKQ
jgi:D-aspartate ligase